MAHVVQGRALERRGRLDEAAVEIEQGAELSRGGVAAVEIAYALLAQAEAVQLQGDLPAARALAAEARRAVERCSDPGILLEMLARVERGLHPELTEKERSILALLPSELSLREIGGTLFLSRNTIKTHIRGIYRKLGVGTRDDAVARARELDLI